MASSFINPAFASSYAASGLGGYGGFGPSYYGSGIGGFGNSIGGIGGFGGFGGGSIGGFGGFGTGGLNGVGGFGFGVPGAAGLYGGATSSGGGGLISGIINASLQQSFAMGQLRAQETVMAAQQAWANAGAYAMTNTPPTQVERFF